ncbi:MARCH5 [Lepeophtheirus salmonis]|uniref:E3 ubiquitin-protein ligase MARCHF5 n=1 Tax=Lepeophtheirus salmonis TaxID=72036 RepID=A0A0K2VJM2_LEPSM|nr:E3 ubiquitin-protein ligase MARCHF5-like [Lepeophtheirus salmonis]CAB4065182.1 MARCH5 [Lepeophtheirus salmonis]CAB4065185.1 MARCH5 [Lepeophtheirus salmonis]CAF2953526.1 MARCH5 [Lepeophtheirus salmonis]CAF2953574.1 MARCH5 [Lepeophtheirus salmonis]
MSSSSSPSPYPVIFDDADDGRQCWICYAYDEDDPQAVWVNPCRCSGTTKWGHQICIQMWIDEKQKYAKLNPVECPQCGTPYVVSFPPVPHIVSLLDSCDQFVERICPILTGGICFASAYWSCVTYGAITVMQCSGHKKGLLLMEKCDPCILLIVLPLVPIALCMGKMIRWHEPIIKFLRYAVPKTPLTRFILPSFAEIPSNLCTSSSTSVAAAVSDPIPITRILIGALFFPAISSIIGATLFSTWDMSHFKKTLCGGLTYIGVKGAFKIYHKQYMFLRLKQRIVLNFNEKNNNKPQSQESSSS